MIKKSNILKAIQEGILAGFKFASNNVANDSSYVNFEDSKVNNVESFNIRKIERQDFVDLGLSVKWAKCNIGATCQDAPDSWYGDYYAWGELEPKPVYTEDTYDLTLYEKYNKDVFHILLPEDDVVTLTYYGIDKFRTPTKEDIEELLDATKIKNEWKTNYQGIKGLNGKEFTSLINGNSIFIPAAGFISKTEDYGKTVNCFILSSSCYSKYFFYLSSDEAGNYIYDSTPIDGLSVRGVCS